MALATPADAVREYTRNVGAEHAGQMWILSPYDSWERNPFYTGPVQPHPEEDIEDGDDWEDGPEREMEDTLNLDAIPF